MIEDIANLIADIEKVACLINMQGKHNVFVENSGHIKSVYFRLFLGGWEPNLDPSLKGGVVYDIKDKFVEPKACLYELKRVRDILRKLYKDGHIDINKFHYETKEVRNYTFNLI